MNIQQQQQYAAPSSVVSASRRKSDPYAYPYFKVILTFTFAPAIVCLFLALVMFVGHPAFAILFGIIGLFYAELLFGIPALIAGINTSVCRWEKNGTDVLKAAVVGGLCAGIPSLIVSPIVALGATLIGAITSMLLAYLVLPKDEWDIPVYEPEEADYWAVEISANPDETQTNTAGVYYFINLPRPSSKHSDAQP